MIAQTTGPASHGDRETAPAVCGVLLAHPARVPEGDMDLNLSPASIIQLGVGF
jgi:hypothetical protein